MFMTTVAEYLARRGRKFPTPDADGRISGERFAEADLPMVVACAHCDMSMVLHERRFVDDESGKLFCDECGEMLRS